MNSLPRKKADLLEEPFFVVGPLRSGTTLLRLLIDHHPQINCFGEFEGAVSQAIGDRWPDLEAYHRFVANDRQTQAHQLTVNKNLDYVELVKSFLEQIYDRQPGNLIGASIHSRMDLLPLIWPKARFIHLLRDPRDVANSCIGMGWVGNVHEGAQYWLKPERHWDLLCSRVDASRRMTVRFEDLVADPDGEMKRICDFLGVEYDVAMLNIEGDTTYSRPSAKFARQWRDKLSPQEIAWVEYQCEDLMKSRGYEVITPELRAPEGWEKFRIWLQNRSYRVKFNVRRYGFLNWLMFISSKRVGPASVRMAVQRKINDIDRRYLK